MLIHLDCNDVIAFKNGIVEWERPDVAGLNINQAEYLGQTRPLLMPKC